MIFYIVSIFKFDTKWELKAVIGHGKGRGPGEALLISDFFVDEEFVWMVDSRQFKIMKFSLSGDLIEETETDMHPLRIYFSGKSIVYLSLGDDRLFSMYDPESVTYNRFGEFPGLDARNSILFNGDIKGEGYDHFYYLPRLYSKLYKYSAMSTDRIQTIDLIDDQELPELNQVSGSTTIQSPGNVRIKNIDLDIHDDRILVAVYDHGENAKASDSDKWSFYLDVYDQEDGEYIRSYWVPGLFQRFSIGNDRMYIVLPSNKVFEFPFRLNKAGTS